MKLPIVLLLCATILVGIKSADVRNIILISQNNHKICDSIQRTFSVDKMYFRLLMKNTRNKWFI